jgi:hypothetical protein
VAVAASVSSLTVAAQDKPASPKAEAAGTVGGAKVKVPMMQLRSSLTKPLKLKAKISLLVSMHCSQFLAKMNGRSFSIRM